MVCGYVSTLYDVKTQFFSCQCKQSFLNFQHVDNPSHGQFSTLIWPLRQDALELPFTALDVLITSGNASNSNISLRKYLGRDKFLQKWIKYSKAKMKNKDHLLFSIIPAIFTNADKLRNDQGSQMGTEIKLLWMLLVSLWAVI